MNHLKWSPSFSNETWHNPSEAFIIDFIIYYHLIVHLSQAPRGTRSSKSSPFVFHPIAGPAIALPDAEQSKALLTTRADRTSIDRLLLPAGCTKCVALQHRIKISLSDIKAAPPKDKRQAHAPALRRCREQRSPWEHRTWLSVAAARSLNPVLPTDGAQCLGHLESPRSSSSKTKPCNRSEQVIGELRVRTRSVSGAALLLHRCPG